MNKTLIEQLTEHRDKFNKLIDIIYTKKADEINDEIEKYLEWVKQNPLPRYLGKKEKMEAVKKVFKDERIPRIIANFLSDNY